MGLCLVVMVTKEKLGHLLLGLVHRVPHDLLGHEGSVVLVLGQAHGSQLGGSLDAVLVLQVPVDLLLGTHVDLGFLEWLE